MSRLVAILCVLVLCLNGIGQIVDKKLVLRADAIIRKKPVAVTQKDVVRSGNPHKYESLSIYWWPDTLNPQGPYVARDGHYNPEYRQYDYPKLLTLSSNLRMVAQAFLQTGDMRYHDYVCRQIDVWFIDDSTSMTPDFEYSQIIPGRNQGRGNPQGLVDAYNFNEVIDAAVSVNDVVPVGGKRMRALKQWMYDFAVWMESSQNGMTASRYINNQAIAYETTLFNIYTFTSHKSKAKKHALRCISHIKSQIEEDGRQPQEMKRAKPLTYVLFNLEHMEYFISKCPKGLIDDETLEKVAKARQFAERMNQANQ